MPMLPDPDSLLWHAHLRDTYQFRNYGSGLAQHFMRRAHVALEREFDHKTRFETVLEVGAKGTFHIDVVRHRFVKYILSDIDPEALAALDNVSLAPGVVVQREDATALSFADRSIDRLIAANVLEHLPEPHKVLREWVRVLKTNGVLSIILPADPGLAWRIGRMLGPRKASREAGVPYDYWMSREHINSIFNLKNFLSYYFPHQCGRWLPLRWLPVADLNLFYVCNIRMNERG